MAETEYMRTIMYKQHGFFAETSQIKDQLPMFQDEFEIDLFEDTWQDRWHKLKLNEDPEVHEAPRPKPNRQTEVPFRLSYTLVHFIWLTIQRQQEQLHYGKFFS